MKITAKILIPVLLFCFTINLGAQNKTEKKDSVKKLSPYEKLFDKKRDVKSVKGVITLYNIEGKLYIELPVSLTGKSFLMGSVVESVSNPALSYSGQRASRPVQICFTKTDSLVQIRLIPAPVIAADNEKGIAEALKKSNIPSILHSAPIAAYNPDSTAVLFDATQFFISGSKYIAVLNASSFGGFIQKTSTFSKDLSSLKDVEAYEDNVSVLSNMTYTITTYFLGMESGGQDFLTVDLRTTLKLLPENNFRYRFADYRIGTGVTAFEKFGSKEQGSGYNYFATRWRVEPADKEAYRNGQLSDPKKQIVFYVDTLFTPSWREAIKRGLLKWNKVFAKAGFKNVIEVKNYPSAKEDPAFSASNNAYSCVKYALTPSRNITRQINTDPRNGEILSANILFYKDSPITLQRERLYETAAYEKGVRDYQLPEDLLCHSIELAMTREMGLCLGLVPNLAATSWIPTDSLRSATFTGREGITSSVTDQIRYNYVAQPGDPEKGVKICADEPGVYDYYAIEWLYRIFPGFDSPVSERNLLRGVITEKIKDKRFYYGKEQSGAAYLDPRAVIEDLGDDRIRSAEYGINTLKYISENGAKWINKDEAAEEYKELFPDFIFLKLFDYYRSIIVNIGGIEINERYEGDPSPAYSPVNRDLQKQSLMFILEQNDNLKWLDNKDMLLMSGMNGSFSDFYANNLTNLVFQRLPFVAFTSKKSADPYTAEEMLNDIQNFALKNALKGDEISEAQRSVLITLTRFLLSESGLPEVNKAKAAVKNSIDVDENSGYMTMMQRCNPSFRLEADEDSDRVANGPVASRMGFETITGFKYIVKDELSALYYKQLLSLRDSLKRAISKTKDEKSADLLGYLLLAAEKGVGGV